MERPPTKDRTKYGVWQGRRKLSVAVLFFKLGIKIKGAYYVAIFDVNLIENPGFLQKQETPPPRPQVYLKFHLLFSANWGGSNRFSFGTFEPKRGMIERVRYQ